MADTSFRNSVVEEIISTPITDGDSVFALVSAIAKNAGVILINKRRINLVMSVDSYAVAMYLVEALKSVYPTEFEISCDEIKSGPKKGERAFTVAVQTGFTKQVLSDALLITEDSCGVELEVPEKFAREYALAVTYLKGAYSLVIMSPAKLIAVRDPLGIRPLCFGQMENGTYVVASESCGLDAVNAKFTEGIP